MARFYRTRWTETHVGLMTTPDPADTHKKEHPLIKLALESGEVQLRCALPQQYFGEGVTVLGELGRGDWRVAVPRGWTNLAFFELAAANGVVVRALTRDDETLEELFLRTVSA